MDMNMEHAMETGVIKWFIRIEVSEKFGYLIRDPRSIDYSIWGSFEGPRCVETTRIGAIV